MTHKIPQALIVRHESGPLRQLALQGGVLCTEIAHQFIEDWMNHCDQFIRCRVAEAAIPIPVNRFTHDVGYPFGGSAEGSDPYVRGLLIVCHVFLCSGTPA